MKIIRAIQNNFYKLPAALAIEKQYYDIQDANIVDENTISGFVQNTPSYKNNNGNPPYNNNPLAKRKSDINIYKNLVNSNFI